MVTALHADKCMVRAVPLDQATTADVGQVLNFALPVSYQVSLVNCASGLPDCQLLSDLLVHCPPGESSVLLKGQQICLKDCDNRTEFRSADDGLCEKFDVQANVVSTQILVDLEKSSAELVFTHNSLNTSLEIRAVSNVAFDWNVQSQTGLPSWLQMQMSGSVGASVAEHTPFGVPIQFNATNFADGKLLSTGFKIYATGKAGGTEIHAQTKSDIQIRALVKAYPSMVHSTIDAEAEVLQGQPFKIAITARDRDGLSITAARGRFFVVSVKRPDQQQQTYQSVSE